MKTVAQTLAAEARVEIHSISPDATVFEAMTRMAEKNLGALIVQELEQLVALLEGRSCKTLQMSILTNDTYSIFCFHH